MGWTDTGCADEKRNLVIRASDGLQVRMRILQVQQGDSLARVLQSVHRELVTDILEDGVVHSQNLVPPLQPSVIIGRAALDNSRHKYSVIGLRALSLIDQHFPIRSVRL